MVLGPRISAAWDDDSCWELDLNEVDAQLIFLRLIPLCSLRISEFQSKDFSISILLLVIIHKA